MNYHDLEKQSVKFAAVLWGILAGLIDLAVFYCLIFENDLLFEGKSFLDLTIYLTILILVNFMTFLFFTKNKDKTVKVVGSLMSDKKFKQVMSKQELVRKIILKDEEGNANGKFLIFNDWILLDNPFLRNGQKVAMPVTMIDSIYEEYRFSHDVSSGLIQNNPFYILVGKNGVLYPLGFEEPKVANMIKDDIKEILPFVRIGEVMPDRHELRKAFLTEYRFHKNNNLGL